MASTGQAKTVAQVLFELGQPLRKTVLSLPHLKPGQIVVDVAFSGVCHSQLHEARGRRGPDAHLPHTLGHEGSGVVRIIGPGVTKVEAGDHVVLTWIKGSGADVPGTAYESDHGRVNSGAISTFMRTTVVSENRVVRIPDAMPLREAALLGCAVPTGAGAVINTAGIRPGDTIAIFGVGGIGLSAVLGAVAGGAGMIIAIDVASHKLAQARELGATHTIDASTAGVHEEILALTSGRGVDCAVEAAGRKETMEIAFKSVRVGGGRCVIAGNLPHGQTISIDPMDLIRGRQILGTWGGETLPDRDIPSYASLFLEGKLPLGRLVTHEYPLEDINRAMEDLESGRVGRALVAMKGNGAD